MSRPRSSDPAIPVSIAMPRSLHTRLSEIMSYKSSRSAFICAAIKARLDAHDDSHQVITSLSNVRLLTILFNRGVIDYEMYVLLKSRLSE